MSEPRESWHLDRRVPIVLIGALMAHAGIGIWYASSFASRLSAVEQFVAENKSTDRRLYVIEEKISAIARSMDRVEQSLGRRSEVTIPN
jgi:hypothetical protein